MVNTNCVEYVLCYHMIYLWSIWNLHVLHFQQLGSLFKLQTGTQFDQHYTILIHLSALGSRIFTTLISDIYIAAGSRNFFEFSRVEIGFGHQTVIIWKLTTISKRRRSWLPQGRRRVRRRWFGHRPYQLVDLDLCS